MQSTSEYLEITKVLISGEKMLISEKINGCVMLF